MTRTYLLNQKINILIVFVLFVTVVLPCSAFGDNVFVKLFNFTGEQEGTTVMPFLTMPVGARGAAMGNASLILLDDVTAAYWNPASLGLLRRYEYSMSHNERPLGVRNEYICLGFPQDYVGTFAAHARMFTAGDFVDSRDEDENPNNPQALDYSLGVSYGGAFIPEKFYAGLSASFVQSRLEEEAVMTGTVDGSFQYFSGRDYKWVFGLKNWGPGVQYTDTKEDLPSGILFGFGRNFEWNGNPLQWGLGLSKYAGTPLEATAGAEIELFEKLRLRGSYTYFNDLDGFAPAKGFALGAGFQEKMLRVEYAVQSERSDIGMLLHYLTLTASLKEITPKNAEGYYEVALKHFKKGKYQDCVEEAENALRLNPNMWKAHVLISSASSMLRRYSGSELTLIYTGCIQGNIAANKKDNVFYGGIARRATAVKQLAMRSPYHVIVDAGNLFDRKTLDHKTEMVMKAMANMEYDVLGTGPGELRNGLERLGAMAEKNNLTYVASNIPGVTMFSSFFDEKTINVGGVYKVYVASVAGRHYEKEIVDERIYLQDVVKILQARMKGKASKADLRVLIVHDSIETIQELAVKFPEIEVIISGGGQIYSKPVVVGNTLILSSGKDGRYVGALNVQFDKRKRMISYQNRLIRLSEEVPKDPQVAGLVNQMIVKGRLIEEGKKTDPGYESTEGTFLFTAERDGKRHVYVKVIKSNMVYGITHDSADHYRPQLGVISGKVAYTAEWTDTATNKQYKDLFTMEMNGTNVKQITYKENVCYHLWHPKKNLLYFCSDSAGNGDTEIYYADDEGMGRKNISKAPYSSETALNFSHSGEKMVFISDRDDKDQLYVTNSVGERPIRFSDDNANHSDPCFSPDDRRIAYLSDRFGFGGKKDLVIQSTMTSKARFITQNANVSSFDWTQDCKYIIYDAGINMSDLNRVRVSDGFLTKLIPTVKIKTWEEKSPRIIWIDSEEWILYHKVENGKSSIYRIRTDGTGNRAVVEKFPNSKLNN